MSSHSQPDTWVQFEIDMAECLTRGESIYEVSIEQDSREVLLQLGTDWEELVRRGNALLQNNNFHTGAELSGAQPGSTLAAQNQVRGEVLLRRLHEQRHRLDSLKIQKLTHEVEAKNKTVTLLVACIVGAFTAHARFLIADLFRMFWVKLSALVAGIAGLIGIPFEPFVEPLVVSFCQLVFVTEVTTQAYEDFQALDTIGTLTTIVQTVTAQAPCTAISTVGF